jgi:prepilin-type N-terminal cleavage/methylation domain-containing protein/prepilin-type processing-associated H-X9-DG protein
MSRKRGFTLVELLVVIAIITLLAGILFPVFAQVREKGRQTVCLSNLRQLGNAYMMYVQDYDDHFPLGAQSPKRVVELYYSPPNLVADKSSPQFQAWYASQGANAVQPYTKNDQIWACPSGTPAESQFADRDLTPGVQPTEISYAFNGLLGAASLGEVHYPVNVIMLWEAGGRVRWKGAGHIAPSVHVLWAWKHPEQWPFKMTDCNAQTGLTTGGLKGTWYLPLIKDGRPETHNGGQNWCYADGHVKWHKIGGNTMDTDPWKDPFRYNPDGTIALAWADECWRPWLFRPDLEPDVGRAPISTIT